MIVCAIQIQYYTRSCTNHVCEEGGGGLEGGG